MRLSGKIVRGVRRGLRLLGSEILDENYMAIRICERRSSLDYILYGCLVFIS